MKRCTPFNILQTYNKQNLPGQSGNGILLTAAATRALGSKLPQEAIGKEIKSDNSFYILFEMKIKAKNASPFLSFYKL